MRGLSVHQPYAHLIALGRKRWETRTYEPVYRGPVAICATKTVIADPVVKELAAELPDEELGFGACVAVARLTQVRECPFEVPNAAEEFRYGDFTEGRFAWELRNLVRLGEPVPVRGYPFLWPLPPESEAQIIDELTRPLVRELGRA
jgi:hypothetical protein